MADYLYFDFWRNKSKALQRTIHGAAIYCELSASHLHQVGLLRDSEFVDPFGVLVGEGLDFFLEVLLSVLGDEVVGLGFRCGVHS